jgi:hypothetical protein
MSAGGWVKTALESAAGDVILGKRFASLLGHQTFALQCRRRLPTIALL